MRIPMIIGLISSHFDTFVDSVVYFNFFLFIFLIVCFCGGCKLPWINKDIWSLVGYLVALSLCTIINQSAYSSYSQVLHTFFKVLTRRICLTIMSLFSWWSFPLLSCDQEWYCRETWGVTVRKHRIKKPVGCWFKKFSIQQSSIGYFYYCLLPIQFSST